MNKNKIVAIIPARKGSQRVKNKNIRKFQGIPLVELSIRSALKCSLIDQVVVSTDDQVVKDIICKYDIECFDRPPHLAHETARTFDVLVDVIERLESKPEFLVLLQATSPLREIDLIQKGLYMIKSNPEASSLIAVYEHRIFTGQIRKGYWLSDYPEETRSQDIPAKYVPSGSLYIYRVSDTIEKCDPFGNKVLPILVDETQSVNIDYEDDFIRLEYVFAKYRNKFSYLLDNLV